MKTLSPTLTSNRQRQLDESAKKLLEMSGMDVNSFEEDLGDCRDDAEFASLSVLDRSLTITGRLLKRRQALSHEVQRALKALDSGTYGNCEHCERPIAMERIRNLIAVTRCAACQKLLEDETKKH